MATYSFGALIINADQAERVALEIFPPANVAIAIKRIRITDAIISPLTTDGSFRVRVYRTSTASTGVSIITPTEKRPESPAARSTCYNQTSATSAAGTKVKQLLDTTFIMNGGAFEWIARDYSNLLWSDVNQRICVTTIAGVNTSGHVSPGFPAELDFIE